MALFVDNVLHLVLGEQLVKPMDQAVERYPVLIDYYFRRI